MDPLDQQSAETPENSSQHQRSSGLGLVQGKGWQSGLKGWQEKEKAPRTRGPERLHGYRGARRADFCAGSTIIAFCGIDEVFVGPFSDRSLRTFWNTSSAIDAFLIDGMTHSLLSYEFSRRCMEANQDCPPKGSS